jgi:hypothetical protein
MELLLNQMVIHATVYVQLVIQDHSVKHIIHV